MTNSPPYDSTDPARDILAYLNAHPQASDSLEGIVSWWLPVRFTTARESVQESLDLLVEQGLVEETRLPDGTLVYSRPPDADPS